MKKSRVTYTVEIPSLLVRLLQKPPFFYTLGALTGVSISLIPLFLFFLGQSGAHYFDWRVLTCQVIIFTVPWVYMLAGSRVIARIWESRPSVHIS